MLFSRKCYGSSALIFLILHKPIALLFRLTRLFVKKKAIPAHPKILLCCWASLGDVFLATTFIDSILQKYPKATLGFLCAPASAKLIEQDPRIAHIHTAPNWRAIGKGKIDHLLSFLKLQISYYPKVVKKIRKIEYDISLELHPFFPDTVFICRRSKIPHRIGFTSSGSKDSLTDPVSLSYLSYLPRIYPLLLGKSLSAPNISRQHTDEQYIILHMGSSDIRKLWSKEHWHFVAHALHKEGFSLVLTGSGAQEKKFIEDSKISFIAKNLCNTLSLQELFSTIAKASLVISIDSLPIHVAAQFGTPLVGLYLYNTHLELWLPDSPNTKLLVNSKCKRKKEDPRVWYLEEISPSHVLSAAFDLLRHRV